MQTLHDVYQPLVNMVILAGVFSRSLSKQGEQNRLSRHTPVMLMSAGYAPAAAEADKRNDLHYLDNEGKNELYWIHKMEYEKTQLRNIYTARLKEFCQRSRNATGYG
ncbi:hypothetical protein EDB81DRAFT_763375 [Dactylonectria macrodidyma]|uniref:Uncharacterized protein n=1 Tax=Dactylonectria macrodidyma TaxID=307937 RepID=A0A9P9IRT1_9HYPO|nr:hypothetical protein EDB81DRAFT_763375 [Dactylonectria macrodidyma]